MTRIAKLQESARQECVRLGIKVTYSETLEPEGCVANYPDEGDWLHSTIDDNGSIEHHLMKDE